MDKKYYTSSTGEQVEVMAINNFHLVNALIKNAQLEGGAGVDAQNVGIGQSSANVEVLKEEVLRRLAPKV